MICVPHWERNKQKVLAKRKVGGTWMCEDCITGRSFRETHKHSLSTRLKLSAAMKRYHDKVSKALELLEKGA